MDEIVQIASHAEDRHDNTALLRFETDAEHSGCVTTIIWTTGMMQFSSKKTIGPGVPELLRVTWSQSTKRTVLQEKGNFLQGIIPWEWLFSNRGVRMSLHVCDLFSDYDSL